MLTLTVRCPAKLNLSFDITGVRSDGYHDIETLFQTIDLEDSLHFKLSQREHSEVEIICADPFIKHLFPVDKSNLIAKAAECFFSKLNSKNNYLLSVTIEKNIPIGAGLAGGSANAAATLLALNHLLDLPLTSPELTTLASQLGSDVPFCLSGGTAIGKGRGELLTPLKNSLPLTFCIVKPRTLSISTPWAYSAFDNYKFKIKKPDLKNSIRAIESGDLELALKSFGNVFESPVFEAHPDLLKLKQELSELGAWYCQMTGSGPTLFAITANREMAQQIRRHFLKSDDLGFAYWTEEILREAAPAIDFKIAESCQQGAYIVGAKEGKCDG